MKTRLRFCLCLLLVPIATLGAVACDESASSTVSAAPAVAPKLEEPEPTPAPLAIDGFEDGDLDFLTRDGSGRWAAEPPGATLAVESGGADGSASALHLTSSAGSSALALMSPGDTPLVVSHDLRSCRSIELWVKRGASDPGGSLELVVSTATGDARVTLEASSEWQKLSFDLGELGGEPGPVAQAGAAGTAGGAATGGAGTGGAAGSGGAPAPSAFDLGRVRSVELTAASAADVWIDELAFTECRLPDINPPLPEPAPLGGEGPEGSPVALHGQLRVEAGRIVDQSGVPLQLRGVSSMWLNQVNRSYASNKEALRFMRDDWGLTVIRAAMGAAEGRNPYIADPENQRRHVEIIVDNAIELGVYVIVDWHAHDQHPDEARGFFDIMAEKYGEEPNVIWETYNEPKKEDWRALLKPYHTSLVRTIRARDPDNLIVLGTPQWSQLVDVAAQDPLGATNVLYALHFYSCTHAFLHDSAEAARQMGLPIFVTEFGATHSDGGTPAHPELCAAEAQVWFDWMGQHGISGAAWKLDSCADTSCIVAEGAPAGGGWTDEQLHGHGPLVRDWIRQ